MQIQIPEKVNQVVHRLAEAGFEAYVVGGCVRDAILGRPASDWDITTNAKPEQVKDLFPRTVDTGIQHGTVTVLLGKEGFEVTTYRIDGEYTDSRHPKEVIFTPSLLEDLKRRDFTINAMAYNDKDGLVDAFDGFGDLQRRQIRCVGNPEERFTEDALRILRAVRFSAHLDFSIEEKTREAIMRFAPNLSKISAERIRVEIVKLLTSQHPESWRTVYETGISAVILPEFDVCMELSQNHPQASDSIGEHTLQALSRIEADKVLRLAVLLHGVGEEMAGKILRRLKFDNETLRRVKHLVKVHDALQIEPNQLSVRRAVFQIGEEYFSDYLKMRRVDILAKNPAVQQERLELLGQIEDLYQKILEEKHCLSLKDLAVTGRDLIEAGVVPGPRLGKILNELLELVIENPEYNTKEYLMSRIPEKVYPEGHHDMPPSGGKLRYTLKGTTICHPPGAN